MKKKSVIILCSVIAICAIGLVSSHFIDWPVDVNDASGDIAKATRFSRGEASEKLTNMEELLQTDSAFKDGIVAAQVVMQTRATQIASTLPAEFLGQLVSSVRSAAGATMQQVNTDGALNQRQVEQIYNKEVGEAIKSAFENASGARANAIEYRIFKS